MAPPNYGYQIQVVGLDGNTVVDFNTLLAAIGGGDVAHDAVDSGNPVKIGGKASTSLPSAVAPGDRVDAYWDEYGRLVVTLGTGLNPSDDIVRAVGGLTTVSAEFTRPANGTAYSQYDVVSNDATTTTFMVFAGVARENGGGGYIVKARLETDRAADVGPYRLWLYKVVNASLTDAIAGDNLAFTQKYSNRLNRIGYIDLTALTTEGTGSDSALGLDATVRLSYTCAAADTAIYGVLEYRGSVSNTPGNGQKFTVILSVEQSN